MAPGHAGAHRPGRARHRAPRRAAVLELPPHGGLGFADAAAVRLAFWYSLKGEFASKPWLLRWALSFCHAVDRLPRLGWFVAEYGRQPWTIYGVLPTHLSVSTLSCESLYGSLAGFIGFYTVLLMVEMYLMVKFARLGPGSLGTGLPLPLREPAHA
jgi:cytochrome d ubiquinol oxidase subunit I